MKKLMFAAAVVGAMVMSAEAVYSVDLSQGRKAELPAAVSGYAEPQSATTCYFLFGNGGASNRSGFITAFSNAIKGDTLESIFNSFGSKGTDWVELGYDDFKGWGTHHILESDTATVGTLIAILAADDGTTWACLPWTDATLKADGTATHGQSWAGSGGVVYDAVAYFEGGYGWIHSAAVAPEPTSALLMLFGLAGLALKRKVA